MYPVASFYLANLLLLGRRLGDLNDDSSRLLRVRGPVNVAAGPLH